MSDDTNSDTSVIAPLLNGKFVLVVEDNDDARTLLGTLLGLYGAQVTTSASVAEAREAFERISPNVVVSDVNMPHEDGYDLIRWIRARSPEQGGQVPVLAVTAFGDDEREALLEAGFTAFFSKPIEPQDIVDAILHYVGNVPENPTD